MKRLRPLVLAVAVALPLGSSARDDKDRLPANTLGLAALVGDDPIAAPDGLSREQEIAREKELFEKYVKRVTDALDQVVAERARVLREIAKVAAQPKRKGGLQPSPEWYNLGLPGGFLLEDSKTGFPRSEAALFAEVSAYAEYIPRLRKCAGISSEDVAPRECDFLMPVCRYARLDSDGQELTFPVVSADLDLQHVAAGAFEELDPNGKLLPAVVWDYAQALACRLWGRRGGTFQSYVIFAADPPPWITAPRMTVADCEARSALEARVKKLESAVAKRDIGIPIIWRDVAASRVKQCAEHVTQYCASVYRIGSVHAMAYVTKGCNVRRVTANDIKSDVERMEGLWTEAERLEHLLVAHNIETCAALAEREWTWTFNDGEKDAADCKAKGAKAKAGSKGSKKPRPAAAPTNL